MMLPFRTAIAASVLLLLCAPSAHGFKEDGRECGECHRLTRQEAATLLSGMVDDVLAVEPSEVAGVWVVDVAKAGRKHPVYIDFSKRHLISGQVIDLASRENLTDSRSARINRVDASSIPLANAVVVGNPEARQKIIVFSDPDCRACALLHLEARKVIAKTRDVAFHVLLFSRPGNPRSVRKILPVICAKKDAAKLLDDAFAGKSLPPPQHPCDSAAVRETAAVAARLGVRGTPAMILPDGRVVNGFRDANTILKMLEEEPPSAQAK